MILSKIYHICEEDMEQEFINTEHEEMFKELVTQLFNMLQDKYTPHIGEMK